MGHPRVGPPPIAGGCEGEDALATAGGTPALLNIAF
jgi:hypothetical protein